MLRKFDQENLYEGAHMDIGDEELLSNLLNFVCMHTNLLLHELHVT